MAPKEVPQYLLEVYLVENKLRLFQDGICLRSGLSEYRPIADDGKKMLLYFRSHPDTIISQEEIQQILNQSKAEAARQTISRLRRLINPFEPIENIRSSGYMVSGEDARRIKIYESMMRRKK